MNEPMLGHLEQAWPRYCDFDCPHCKRGCDAKWRTEFQEPVDGDTEADCPHCGKSIKFNVSTTTTYEVIK